MHWKLTKMGGFCFFFFFFLVKSLYGSKLEYVGCKNHQYGSQGYRDGSFLCRGSYFGRRAILLDNVQHENEWLLNDHEMCEEVLKRGLLALIFL